MEYDNEKIIVRIPTDTRNVVFTLCIFYFSLSFLNKDLDRADHQRPQQ